VTSARPAVFLDRDGTINVRPPEHDYVRDARDFRLLPGAVEGMVTLARAGYPLVVVSNQRGVSRGLVERETLTAIEAHVQRALAPYGVAVESFRYCVHDIDEGCDCRKPRPGMLHSAARDLGLDLGRSWMIGDSESDIEAGRAAGCRTILLTDGADGEGTTARSLLEAARLVGERPKSQTLDPGSASGTRPGPAGINRLGWRR
jgi:D-glycero-D-manno-heptose 1,7-bisphosphate phosphatase